MRPETRTGEVLEVRATADGGHEADIRIVKYNVVDTYKTRFKPGVFQRQVAEGSLSAVWSHDPSRPIGVVTNFRDSADSLDGTLKFLDFEAVPDARMAHAAMKAGAIKGISFGFERNTDERAADDDEVRDIIDANLVEASPVLRPAVPGARVLAVRSTEVIPASVAADLVTRFAAGLIDLADALTELKEHRTSPLVSEEPEDNEESESGGEFEQTAAEEAAEAAEEEEGEDLPEDMVGPVADEDEEDVLGVLDRAAGKPRTAASNGVYADPGLQADKKKRYPLGNKDQCIAAWRYINMPKNSKMYSSGQLGSIKGKIKSAAKKFGVNIAENDRKN